MKNLTLITRAFSLNILSNLKILKNLTIFNSLKSWGAFMDKLEEEAEEDSELESAPIQE